MTHPTKKQYILCLCRVRNNDSGTCTGNMRCWCRHAAGTMVVFVVADPSDIEQLFAFVPYIGEAGRFHVGLVGSRVYRSGQQLSARFEVFFVVRLRFGT